MPIFPRHDLFWFSEVVAVLQVTDRLASSHVRQQIPLIPHAAFVRSRMGRSWHRRRSLKRSDNDQALATLRNAVVGCQDSLLGDAITESIEGLKQELEPFAIVIRVRERKDVLQQEHSRPRFVEDADVVLQQAGLRVKPAALLLDPVARFRKWRTRRAADKQLGLAAPEPGSPKQFAGLDSAYVTLENSGSTEVRPERVARVGVVLHSGSDREAGLFDAEIEPSGAGKQ